MAYAAAYSGEKLISEGQMVFAAVAGSSNTEVVRKGVLVLNEAEIRECVTLDREALAAVEAAFSSLAAEEAFVAPIMGILIPEREGEVDVKSAYIRGLPSFAIKIASGFFLNSEIGLPNSSGLMIVVSAESGFPEAVLLDNGYLTDVRTGLAGAICAKHLAPKTVDTVGVIGAGVQGRYQVRALQLVRDFKQVLVYDKNATALVAYVAEMPGVLGVPVVAATDARSVVEQSEIVITSTPSREPFVRPEWLHPSLHITAMGADLPEKTELYPGVLARADRVACDFKAQCFVRGELYHALQAGVISPNDNVSELGDLTSGRVTGRADESQITVCALTGVGVQDTAIALLAYQRARERSLGLVCG